MLCYHCMKEIPNDSKSCPFCNHIPNQQNPQHQLAAGTVLFNRYIVGNKMGESKSVVTYAGLDSSSNDRVVIKEYYPSGYAERRNAVSNTVLISASHDKNRFEDEKKEFMREVLSLSRFSEELHYVKVLDYFSENNTAYMVTEFLDGSTLAQTIQKNGIFSPDDLIGKVLPLVRLLEKMHREGVVCRDISPDVIMVMPDGRFVLFGFDAECDFSDNISEPYSSKRKNSYAPYELYVNGNHQGPWTDVYALCAVVYESITGVKPTDAPERVVSDELKKPSELGISIAPHREDAILKGLAVLPKDRVQSMSELAKMLANTPEPALEVQDSPLTKKSGKSRHGRKIAVAACIAAALVLAAAGITAANVLNRTSVTMAVADSTAAAGEEPLTTNDMFAAEESTPAGAGLVISPEIEYASAQSRSFLIDSFYNIVIVDENKQARMYNLFYDAYPDAVDASSAERGPIALTNNEDIVSAVFCYGYCYGLRTDGTMCVLRESTDYQKADSGSWDKIRSLAAIDDEILAVYNDGTVASLQYETGGNAFYRPYLSEIAKWSDIVDVTFDGFDILGLKSDGTVCYANMTEDSDWVKDYSGLNNVAALARHSSCLVLKNDGTLDFPDNVFPLYQDEVSAWQDIVAFDAYAGNYAVAVKKDGTVIAAGDNSCGQCNVSGWKDIVAVQTGENYCIGKKADGTFVIATNNTALAKAFDEAFNKKQAAN